jgi:hypothetical protein
MGGMIEKKIVNRGELRLEVLAQGKGPTMVLLPPVFCLVRM